MVYDRLLEVPFVRPLRSTHFKQVSKIRAELQRDRNGKRLESVVGNAHFLVARGTPQRLTAGQVQGPARNMNLVRPTDINIREVGREQNTVVAHGGTEEHGRIVGDRQRQFRQESRSFEEDACLSKPAHLDVAKAVKDGKHVSVLQDPVALIDGGRFGCNVKLRGLGFIQRALHRPKTVIPEHPESTYDSGKGNRQPYGS